MFASMAQANTQVVCCDGDVRVCSAQGAGTYCQGLAVQRLSFYMIALPVESIRNIKILALGITHQLWILLMLVSVWAVMLSLLSHKIKCAIACMPTSGDAVN